MWLHSRVDPNPKPLYMILFARALIVHRLLVGRYRKRLIDGKQTERHATSMAAHQIKFAVIAKATACARVLAPSRRLARSTWACAVDLDMDMSRAISASSRPLDTWPKASLSREESRLDGLL